MKRFILLLAIGALALTLSFACGPSSEKKQSPEEQDSTGQETHKSSEKDS